MNQVFQIDDLNLEDFLNYECKSYWKQLFTPPHRKTIAAYPLKLVGGQLSQKVT